MQKHKSEDELKVTLQILKEVPIYLWALKHYGNILPISRTRRGMSLLSSHTENQIGHKSRFHKIKKLSKKINLVMQMHPSHFTGAKKKKKNEPHKTAST